MAGEDPLPSPRNPNIPTTSSTFDLSFPPSMSLNPTVLEQYTNSYFLHHSDSTNLVIVSNLLTETNYTSWSQVMVIGLIVKNKLGFVDGSIPRSTGDLLSSWIICDGVVTAWILNSLPKEISISINFADSARKIWVDLQERYQCKNRPRVFQLRRELSNLY
ncbi:uncharacterized protein LOC120089012 [Benincasa hispida]|uniref:uncharacterized protein LOC120089012 n=1 Tax=Benincasa hispida TaxID=102211 RepID=UPI001902813A|nr:uncharacterized protein LOC120089012 [Benincasa hispida]